MAKTDNLDDFLKGIADAIREKKGTKEPINAQNFTSEIASISTGGGSDMPVIGDEKTYLYIKIAEKGRMKVPLWFTQTVANGVTIDWGDESAPQTLSGTGNVNTTHTYADVGEYVISLNPADGCILELGYGKYATTSSSYCVMGSTSSSNMAYCNMLQAVEIGKNVKNIGSLAFRNCHSLTSITIPDGVTSDKIEGSVKYLDKNTFDNCYSLTSIVIPKGFSTLNENIFNNCYSLTRVVIPNSVTSIGDNAFYNCYSLSDIVIPNSITSIGYYAFGSCRSLSNIVIPNSVTSIGNYTFNNCYSLASVVIPSSVTSIGNYAFSSCSSVAFYDFSQCTSVPTLGGTSVFSYGNSDCKIVVPDALYDEWIGATNWSSYASKIVKASEFNA